MVVEIDKQSGFCFGVQNAVKIAEKALLNGEKVFSLGPIVHNDKEVDRLSSLGLVSINHEEFGKLKNCKVLIRAHGEPPETYKIAEKNNLTIIEATCPIVKRLQSKIRETWLRTKEGEGQVVIFGKPGHAEVIGLLGRDFSYRT
jgi:4-hydroxy-3-methylbut-2-en-1-yl diphosphate reductase